MSETLRPVEAELELQGLIRSSLAREASLNRALARYYQHEAAQKQHLLDHDRKTGLLSSDGFYRHATAELKSHPETRRLYVRLDIGNFKRINDTWGHAYGDEILARVGHTFRLGDHDMIGLVAREGGDELVALLDIDDVRTPAGAAMTYEEREQAIIERLHGIGDVLRSEDPRLEEVGFNFAVGTYLMQPGDTLQGADQIADINMYADKELQKARFGCSRP